MLTLRKRENIQFIMVTRIYAIYSRVMIKDDILMCVPFNEKKIKSFSMGEK